MGKNKFFLLFFLIFVISALNVFGTVLVNDTLTSGSVNTTLWSVSTLVTADGNGFNCDPSSVNNFFCALTKLNFNFSNNVMYNMSYESYRLTAGRTDANQPTVATILHANHNDATRTRFQAGNNHYEMSSEGGATTTGSIVKITNGVGVVLANGSTQLSGYDTWCSNRLTYLNGNITFNYTCGASSVVRSAVDTSFNNGSIGFGLSYQDKIIFRNFLLIDNVTIIVPINSSVAFNGSGVPANAHSFNQSFMNFSQMAYFVNNSVNCSLVLNGGLNGSKNFSSLTNATYSFNITFDKVLNAPAGYNWSISCKSFIDNVTYNSSTQTFYLDVVYPNFVTNLVNNSYFFRNNLSMQINFSDDFYLNSFNISIDGVHIVGNDSLTGNFSQFNFSRNVSNLSSGPHILTIRTSDGHTAKSIPDYEVSNGLLNNYLQYTYEDNGRKSVKISTDSVLDTFSTEKKFDRYTFDFQPYDTSKSSYNFDVETDDAIRVIEDDSVYLKTWIVFGNKWVDFYLSDENASVKITKVSDKHVKVKVSGLKNKALQRYQSIGDLNVYEANFTFYNVNASASAQSVVFEGSTTSLTLNVTTQNISFLNTSAYLVWAGRSYNATKTNISVNVTQFYSSFVATNSTNPTNWTWFFNVSNTPFNLSGASNFTAMNITNCSAGTNVVLNYTIFDEELQTPESVGVNATIENYLTLQNPDDPSFSYNFTIKQSSYNLLICLPSGVMNQSSWILNALTKYDVTDHVQEFHYIENFNLTNALIPKRIGLYDLQSSKSTSFLITYQDENYLYVEGVVVDLLRKYISQSGQFYSVEHAKTDSGGQTRLHFVTEDVIYKANVWQNGVLLYTTGEFQALCQATPCQINLRKPYENTEGISVLSNIVYSMTPQNAFHSGKSVTFSFSTKDGTSTNIVMNVTRSTTLTNETICSESTTTSAGSVVCAIPLAYQNATYLARVYMDGEILGFRTYTDELSAKETFGDTGIFLTALGYLMLAFMGISSPTASIVLGIIGLMAMGGMTLIDGMSAFGVGATLLWLIIAGAILIWKYQQRRVQ